MINKDKGMDMEEVIKPRNYFIFGGFGEGDEYKYLVADMFTKTAYTGKEVNGTMTFEKLTPRKWQSLLKKEEIEMLPCTLIPDKKDNSIMVSVRGINFENAIPKNYPVE